MQDLFFPLSSHYKYVSSNVWRKTDACDIRYALQQMVVNRMRISANQSSEQHSMISLSGKDGAHSQAR